MAETCALMHARHACGYRRDSDDRTAAGSRHRGRVLLGDMEAPDGIDPQDLFEFGYRRGEGRRGAENARRDGDAISRGTLCDEVRYRIRVAHVDLHCGCVNAPCGQGLRRVLRMFRVDIGNQEGARGVCTGEFFGDSTPNPTRGTHYDGQTHRITFGSENWKARLGLRTVI